MGAISGMLVTLLGYPRFFLFAAWTAGVSAFNIVFYQRKGKLM